MSESVNVNEKNKSFLDKARDAYGENLPDWIETLALEADRTTQSAAALRIGYCGAVVSGLINKKYTGDWDRTEAKVRGALMGEEVLCPEAGSIRRDRCLNEQKMPFNASSPHRIALYRACRSGCEHSRLKVEGSAA